MNIINNYGLIAILIITLFVGVISSLLYNMYLFNTSLKRMSKANGYVIDMAEYVDKLYYDDVTEDNLINYFNEKYYYQKNSKTPNKNAEVKAQNTDEKNEETPFTVKIDVQKYNEIEGNEDKLDLVKQVRIIAQYKLGNKLQEITINKPKKRENLTTPNEPNLDLLKLEGGQVAYPVKEINSQYIVCNSNDNNWYDYNNNKYALAVVTTEELKIGDTVENSNYKLYKWTPRFAKNSEEDIKYLYSTTNKYVDRQGEYEKLLDLEEGYTVDNSFGKNEGKWEEFNKNE